MRNGMRRLARSVIEPNKGEAKKTIAIEMAEIIPTVESTFRSPTWSLTQSEKFTEITPIEKIVFARSYNTQPVTARLVTRCEDAAWLAED
jgi:hypothetical protein